MLNKSKKKEIITLLESYLTNYQSFMVTAYSGLTVKKITDIRRKFTDYEAKTSLLSVFKNNLIKAAMHNASYITQGNLEKVDSMLSGQNLFVFSKKDLVELCAALLKEEAKFDQKREFFSVKAVCLSNLILSREEIKSLAKYGNISGLRGSVLCSLQSPVHRFLYLLSMIISRFIYILQSKSASTMEDKVKESS